ncbi:MAG: enoyl-CoA hydratase [Casimicrobiaceae bacterium]|nr:enoyl-CoA hydratase [Casimicrobiaceae bacterium]MCX8098981.1 enoyl-CoA hydratase [Casimicrobiaceae bacterium]MDW8313088.1 enoyl-CoA hydratase [Burkholderiales bacterium]
MDLTETPQCADPSTSREGASVGEPLILRSPEIGARDGVVRLTLNRPQQFNALSYEVLAALETELAALETDPEARVVVLAGTGRAFCAGHDLREMRAHEDEAWLRALFDRCSAVMLQIARLPQVVIARVHGIATAAGCQLVAACDLAVASSEARFATSGIRLGLFCSTPSVPLIMSVGRKAAAEMLFTGDFLSAEQAERIGLVNRVVPPEALDEAVAELAARVARHSGHALASGKRLLHELSGDALAAAYASAARNMARDMMSCDARAGIDAFNAKRPLPAWQHR